MLKKYPQLKNPNFYFMILMDIFLFIISLYVAYLLRFEFTREVFVFEQVPSLLAWIIPLKVFIFIANGLYRGLWRYTGLRDVWLLGRACFFSTACIFLILMAMNGLQGYSRGVLIADGLLTLFFTGGIRIAIRAFYAMRLRPVGDANQSAGISSTRVLIVGAGQAGEKILREIMDNYRLRYNVIGFVDDDPGKQGRTIHGVQVLGTHKSMPTIIVKQKINLILIAIPSASGEQIRRIVEVCQQSNTAYKILPGIGDLIDGRVSVKFLRDIRYEDLLGRSPVHLDIQGIRHYLDDKIVMITGCGGSIGSELCRQVIKFQPRKLILLDGHEANLFHIHMEMKRENYDSHCVPVLGWVQDQALMEHVFERHKPEVIFHAAAYKHVPMMEKNPWQAVYNNIIGSRELMDMAVKHHVGRFVLVSTDKAVRPTNVMGASKRVAELIMQCQQGNGTKFMAVRFGNVIGSSGSVIPFFRSQIEQGGPVTVTHPEVNRFFMTIPEASQMILQAGAMGEGGEIFILRMGTPIKIVDMARDLIRLSGKEPEVDIKIVFTGLREGEKLYEELITVGEDILPTDHKKVMVLRAKNCFNGFADPLEARENLYREIDKLKKIAFRHDSKGIKKKLQEIVPEYIPQENEGIL